MTVLANYYLPSVTVLSLLLLALTHPVYTRDGYGGGWRSGERCARKRVKGNGRREQWRLSLIEWMQSVMAGSDSGFRTPGEGELLELLERRVRGEAEQLDGVDHGGSR